MLSCDPGNNMTVQKYVTLILVLTLLCPVTLAGLGSRNVKYVGGTWPQVKAESEGTIDLDDPKVVKFSFKKTEIKTIPFEKIKSLEYGLKAGRRVGAAIGVGVITLGIGAILLLSKKKRHFLSIVYTNEAGTDDGVVFELGKDITRQTLMILETRTGKQIAYESEDAKKNIGNY